MKRFIPIISALLVIAGYVAVGCSRKVPESPSSRHLTESQVLAIAKPEYPLNPGEFYHLSFTNDVWTVWVSDDGSVKGSWGSPDEMTIQDAGGKILSYPPRHFL